MSKINIHTIGTKNLTANIVRVGDIVKLQEEIFQSETISNSRHFNENLFTIKRIDTNHVVLSDLDDIEFDYDKIEAVLINSKEDDDIYYDPLLAADVVKADEPLPIHTTNFQNYLLSFKDINSSKGQSLYDVIIGQGFSFVHDIQHWMHDEENDRGLRIRYTPRVKK